MFCVKGDIEGRLNFTNTVIFCFSCGCTSEDIAGPYSSPVFNASFLETDRPFSKEVYQFTFQPAVCKDSDVSTSADT